jgi:hypothetical protein
LKEHKRVIYDDDEGLGNSILCGLIKELGNAQPENRKMNHRDHQTTLFGES